jgi:L-alanine-DL-glutamate epimerase-like enolase superfamily enzyme
MLTIRQVDAFLLSFPMPERLHLPYYGGDRYVIKRDAMLIRVEAENGLIGYAPGQGSPEAHHHITTTVAPFLQGHTLADPDALRVLFQTGPGVDPAVLKAYCSVEVALYDLLGKFLGVPISELAGGRVRDSIRLYGSAGMYQPPECYAVEAAGVASLGFRAYKMRPALGPEDDVKTVRLMRDAVGPGVDLMVDAHSWWRMGERSYSPETVERVASEMAECDIAWLEEPLPPHDHAAYQALHEKNIVPIATGEHEPSEASFEDLIASRCADYVQMDIVCQGGYATARRLFGGIARAGLRFAFHSWGTDLEVLAASHLGICWPETVVEWLEYPVYSTPQLKTMYPFPLAREILNEPLEIRDGELIVPNRPGLGIEVNEEVIGKYPWIPGPWSFFKLVSPPQTFAVTADHSMPWAGEIGR